jgi:anti-sigma B factor antagonist
VGGGGSGRDRVAGAPHCCVTPEDGSPAAAVAGRRRLPARGGLRACASNDAASADSFPTLGLPGRSPPARPKPTSSAHLALAGPSFEIRENVDADGVVRLTLIGELDIAVADRVEDRFRQLREDDRPVRLDLSQLEFIDSSGVRAIVLGLKHARQGGHTLEVDQRISPTVARMIDIMGIGSQLWPHEPPG